MIKGSNRDKRLLEATKASRTKTGIGPPNKAEGNDGDFQVRQIHNKVKLFVKYKNIWHGVNVGKSFDKVEKKAEEASITQNLPSNRNQILAKKLILRDIGGDIVTPDSGYGGVYVKSDKLYFINDSGGAGQIGGAATLNGLSDVTYDGTVLTIDGLDEIVAAGDLTLDIAGDIILSAAGRNVTMDNGATTTFDFNTHTSFLKIMDATDTGDFCSILVGISGATTIATTDAGAAVGHLSLVPDGNLILDPASKITIINESIVFNTQTHQDITTGGITVDWNNGNKQSIDITGTGYTLTMTNPGGPCNLILKVIQGDGADTITTWAASSGSVYWAGGTIPSLSTGNGNIDIISLYFDGTNYFAVASYNFATV